MTTRRHRGNDSSKGTLKVEESPLSNFYRTSREARAARYPRLKEGKEVGGRDITEAGEADASAHELLSGRGLFLHSSTLSPSLKISPSQTRKLRFNNMATHSVT